MEQNELTVAAYLANINLRKLVGARCQDCKSLYLPARPICSNCHGRDMAKEELGGEGTVIGFTSITVSPTALAARGYGRDRPYLTAVVALNEGPCVPARLEVEATQNLEQYASVGMAVKADFIEETDGENTRTTLVFRPV